MRGVFPPRRHFLESEGSVLVHAHTHTHPDLFALPPPPQLCVCVRVSAHVVGAAAIMWEGAGSGWETSDLKKGQPCQAACA